jgi:16S rRNA processing protein RimM
VRGDPRIEIGGIARAHGIRGEVVVHTHDPESTILGDLDTVWVGGVERAIERARGTDKGWLVKLAGCDTRTDAERLAKQVVEVDRDRIELDDGDVLLDDLVGCKTQLADGTPWGEVVAIDAGPQDRLVVRDGNRERLLPLVDVFVTSIDLEAGVIVVAPPDGLPEDIVAADAGPEGDGE